MSSTHNGHSHAARHSYWYPQHSVESERERDSLHRLSIAFPSRRQHCNGPRGVEGKGVGWCGNILGSGTGNSIVNRQPAHLISDYIGGYIAIVLVYSPDCSCCCWPISLVSGHFGHLWTRKRFRPKHLSDCMFNSNNISRFLPRPTSLSTSLPQLR